MKYTPEMNRELRRAVQNFNKKRKTLEEKGVSASLLPTKASVRSLKLAYDNKRDLNRRLKQMRTFTARGEVRSNTKNVRGTSALFEYRQKDINKARTRQIQHAKRIASKSVKYQSVRDEALLNTQAKIKYLDKDIEEIDVKTLQRLNKNALTKEENARRNETFYNSYFKMLYIEAGQSDFDYDKAKSIENELRKLTPQQLLELRETDSTVAVVTDQFVDSDTKLSKKGAVKLANKLDALYEALPEIKGKYGIR